MPSVQDLRPPPEPSAPVGYDAPEPPVRPDWAPQPPAYPDWAPPPPAYPDWAPEPPAHQEWTPEPAAASHEPTPPAFQGHLPTPEPPAPYAVPLQSVVQPRPRGGVTKATAADGLGAAPQASSTPIAERVAELARSAGAPLFRWTLRLGAVAAVLALMALAGSAAHTYWLKLTAPKMGTAVLETTPPGSQVIVDGQAMGTTPLTAELTAGPHVVELRYRNASRTLKIEVTADGSIVERHDWTAKPTGRLRVTSDPSGARVFVDGRDRGATPLTVDGLSVGSHDVVLESDKGSVKRSVTVAADRTAQLTESIYPGWVRVFSPVDLEISDGTRVLRADERNQVMLPSGSRELVLENRALGYREVRRVDLDPGETITLSIVPTPTKLTVEATLPAEVFIDDERVGDTPLVDAPIDLGTRVVTVKSATGGERRFTMTVTVEPIRLEVDFSKP